MIFSYNQLITVIYKINYYNLIFKELLFMCWTRETGVIPVALVGMLQGMQVPGADIIAAVTFMAILLTIVIQASTTRWLADKLDLLE